VTVVVVTPLHGLGTDCNNNIWRYYYNSSDCIDCEIIIGSCTMVDC
jgi:hypothetical protein